jgi:hypothetical protein
MRRASNRIGLVERHGILKVAPQLIFMLLIGSTVDERAK